jgi:muramidase (phage lysozyme)
MTIHSQSTEAELEPQPPADVQAPLLDLSHARQFGKVALQFSQRTAQRGLQQLQRLGWRKQFLLVGTVLAVMTLKPKLIPSFDAWLPPAQSLYPPLAMAGGDPYVRALMRTISASESNDVQPYGLLYGGTYFSDWSNHPDRCVTIVAGPNEGDCTTAAGRYQFITSTWNEKARLYHPHPDGWLFWQHYSFDPVSQDQVVHGWLTDAQAWEIDIPTELRNGRLNDVLYALSGTWTSLGSGIESNEMTPLLPKLYQRFLKEELKQAQTQASLVTQPPTLRTEQTQRQVGY